MDLRTPDYFAFFGLPRRLTIDAAELERRYYDLSRRLHPDVHFRRGPREQQESLEAAAILNDAYRTLKDPATRAEYLLRSEGVEVAERVPQELIEEVYGYNLALEEADAEALAEARRKFAGMLEDTAAELEQAARRYDAEPGPEALARVGALVGRRRFLTRLLAAAESRA